MNKKKSCCMVCLLYCQNCIQTDSSVAIESEKRTGFNIKPVKIACSSKVQVHHILKILEKGIDAVKVVACPEDKCRFLVGSIRAEKRIEYAGNLLEEIGMEKERISITRQTGLSARALIDLAVDHGKAVKKLTS